MDRAEPINPDIIDSFGTIGHLGFAYEGKNPAGKGGMSFRSEFSNAFGFRENPRNKIRQRKPMLSYKGTASRPFLQKQKEGGNIHPGKSLRYNERLWYFLIDNFQKAA